MRMHLTNSTEEESKIFSEALGEVLGPLENPRYVISRHSRFFTETWLTKILPEVLAKYFRPIESKLVMYHSVPKILASKRADADVFLRYWQEFISQGSYFTRTALKANCVLNPFDSKISDQRMQPRKSKSSYEQLGQVILSPLQAAQKRFLHL